MTGMLLYDLTSQQIAEWHKEAERESLARLVQPDRPLRLKINLLLQRLRWADRPAVAHAG